MGFRDSYEVPNKAQLEAAVKERLTDLEDVIIRIFFTFEHAKSALRRINEKTQPNGENNQQFKDSAIWEAILTLSDSYTIYFISADKHFFKNREKQTEELADNLLNECNREQRYLFITILHPALRLFNKTYHHLTIQILF